MWILLIHSERGRCEVAVRCACRRTSECRCVISHMAFQLLSTHLVHPLRQIRLHANTRLAFTMSPKQLHVLRKKPSDSDERTAKGKSQRSLQMDAPPEAERNRRLSQSEMGRAGGTNRSRSQKLKQLEIEMNQSGPGDRIN